MKMLSLSASQVDQFAQQGFAVVRKLFSSQEMARLLQIATADPRTADARSFPDDSGRRHTAVIYPPRNRCVYTEVSSMPRITALAGQLLDGEEPYIWQTALFCKQPRTGGAVPWHQDFKFWQRFGQCNPQLISCQVAITAADPANGCLEVMPGSHELGLLEHCRLDSGQTPIADEEMQRLGRFPIEALHVDVGDALFFHCLLAHRSGANGSPQPRWTLMSTYNAKSNSPVTASPHSYRPIVTSSNEILCAV